MSCHFKKHSHLLLTFFTLTLILTGALFAGTLTNTSAPTPTMYTLEDIYNLIHNNATSTHSLSTNLTPAKSMHSVSDVYIDLANLIDANNVASGTTYLGVLGGGSTPAPLSSTTIPFTPVTSAGTAIGYTLNDVYHLITDNTRITSPAHPFTAPALSASQHTLTEIYDALVNLITPANVKSGVTYLGKVGSYDPCTTSGSGFFAGDGLVGSPYQICDWTQLNNVRNHLTSSYILNNNLSSTTGDYSGLGDVWDPISGFSGNFDGGNNIISDLIINLPEYIDVNSDVGLFGTSAGSISNIGLNNVTITGYRRVGALVGYQNGGKISNAYSSNVTISGYGEIGGLVGQYRSSTEISNSHSGGLVSGSYAIGGLIGYSRGVIDNSYSTVKASGSFNIGGLVGSMDSAYSTSSRINGSYATGNVSCTQYCGGLAGRSGGSIINNSYATGKVTGGQEAGGLVGWLDGGTISNSYSTGNVTGSSYVGGLLGNQRAGSISNSYWDINTSGQPTSAGGIGTITAMMKKLYTFNSFGGNWDIAGGQANLNNGYPYLSGTTPIWYIADNTVTPPDPCVVSGDATDPDCWSAGNIANGNTRWSTGYLNTGANSDTDGAANQEAITGVGGPWDGNPGAVSNYSAFAYCELLDDSVHPVGTWYLPAKQQLIDAYNASIPGFLIGNNYYWSSTEFSVFPESNAWFIDMYAGAAYGDDKNISAYLIRCLR